MEERHIEGVILKKWSVYRPVLPTVQLRFLRREPYLEAARGDGTVRMQIDLGWFDDFEAEFHDPVLADLECELITACPSMLREAIDPEPPRIQRAFIEGAFMRRMFRFLVAGTGWEADEQVRDVMARHFPFHLVAVEAVEGSAHDIGRGV
jgi:hypothetical protein